MEHYRAPISDMMFALKTFKYQDRVASLAAYEDFDIDTLEELLKGTAAVITKEILPLNAIGDKYGVTFNPEDGSVTLLSLIHI